MRAYIKKQMLEFKQSAANSYSYCRAPIEIPTADWRGMITVIERSEYPIVFASRRRSQYESHLFGSPGHHMRVAIRTMSAEIGRRLRHSLACPIKTLLVDDNGNKCGKKSFRR
jgi:hypothetical protein